MKRTAITSIALFTAMSLMATTNVLQLTWTQPPGWFSTLYSSTNLVGDWTSLGVISPPVNVEPTNQVSFFSVILSPTNSLNEPIIYLTNPNTEGLLPIFTNKPCYAYDEFMNFPVYFWSPTDQVWR